MLRKIAFVLLAIFGSCSLMTCASVTFLFYIQPGIPVEAMAGAKPRSDDTLGSIDLHGILAGAPAESRLEVFDVERADGANERRALVRYADRTVQYLGSLTYQLPDTPIQTMFLRAGNTRVMVASVDEELRDGLMFAVVTRPWVLNDFSDSSRTSTLDNGSFLTGLTTMDDKEWTTINTIELRSHASLLRDDNPNEWEKKYTPAFRFDGLFIDIDQQLAQKPTEQ